MSLLIGSILKEVVAYRIDHMPSRLNLRWISCKEDYIPRDDWVSNFEINLAESINRISDINTMCQLLDLMYVRNV